MKAAFALTARNKEKYVAKAVVGALSQTYPCDIMLSDQHSSDRTYEVMEETVANTPLGHKDSKVRLLRCPIDGPYAMGTANAHFVWLSAQTDAEWIFQCSADDYSLPDRVKVCMFAQEAHKITADTIANTMWFENAQGVREAKSEFAQGFAAAGQGLVSLVYGSCIHAFHRDFIKKVGSPGDVTMDVYYGYVAALGRGFYVVNDPQHVHSQRPDVNNMGFQGKIAGAHAEGNQELVAQLNELNHFQLYELYYQCALAQQRWYPLAHEPDRAAPIQLMIGQSVGWYNRRKELHQKNIVPKVLVC